MLDLKFIRENVEMVKEAISIKNVHLNLDELLQVDRELQASKQKMQDLQTERNANAKKIPSAKPEDRPELISRGKEIATEIEKLKPQQTKLEEELQKLMWMVPNIPSEKAPRGRDESDNVEVKRSGTIPSFDFTPKNHIQILTDNNWAEFERIAEVSGSRSYALKNEMVLLELAIHRLALEILLAKNFSLLTVPSLVRQEALYGTGHFPTGKDQVYYLQEDDLYLSGTAEVQLNSLHRGEILEESKLPMRYAGYSPCFRREAGSYGKDVKGLIRVHQFMKVEQYVITKNDPEESDRIHQELLATAEEVMRSLELPYRVVECCTGDMGAGKVRMFDIEGWVPSEGKYRETHSCSNLQDWQARRSDLRYRSSTGKVLYCHTLNNTAIATPRILVPLLEVHQQKDGRIYVPKALRAFLGGREFLGVAGGAV
ncbi:MAG: serine--tRNA ligase [Oligoflexia bacterium]|nr:serine--tRNA ligase [Oligoflexia bacterium]MBF0365810.1 serine--tRNA ligase [Oligoflexia bacterium]